MNSKTTIRTLSSKWVLTSGIALMLLLAASFAGAMDINTQAVTDFGVVDFTADQTMVLSFANVDRLGNPSTPVPVELVFEDGNANTLLSQQYTVQAGETVSLRLTNDLIYADESVRVPVRALMKTPLSFKGIGIGSMEMKIGTASSCAKSFIRNHNIDWSRFVPDVKANSLNPSITGPFSMETSWTARLSLSNYGYMGYVPAFLQAKMSFVDSTGKTLKEKTLTLGYQQWADLDLRGDEVAFTGPVFARVDYLAPTRAWPSVNLELFDTATGMTVGSSSSGGGGGGGGMS